MTKNTDSGKKSYLKKRYNLHTNYINNTLYIIQLLFSSHFMLNRMKFNMINKILLFWR